MVIPLKKGKPQPGSSVSNKQSENIDQLRVIELCPTKFFSRSKIRPVPRCSLNVALIEIFFSVLQDQNVKLIRELRLEIERLKGIIRTSEKTGDQVGWFETGCWYKLPLV